jgi:predicted transcriptional regulator of viral defense system
MPTEIEKTIRMIRRLGVVRSADLESRGLSRQHLYRLVRKGEVERRGRGIYVASGHSYSINHSLVQVAKKVPQGVVCLLSALRFHELTTQLPAEVWIALPGKARQPRLDNPRLQILRFSGEALTNGIELHRIERVDVRIYSAAKTVADCFKFRNKIGIDVAVEALRDFSRRYRGGAADLSRFARICRVSRVMQPYLDSIV